MLRFITNSHGTFRKTHEKRTFAACLPFFTSSLSAYAPPPNRTPSAISSPATPPSREFPAPKAMPGSIPMDPSTSAPSPALTTIGGLASRAAPSSNSGPPAQPTSSPSRTTPSSPVITSRARALPRLFRGHGHRLLPQRQAPFHLPRQQSDHPGRALPRRHKSDLFTDPDNDSNHVEFYEDGQLHSCKLARDYGGRVAASASSSPTNHHHPSATTGPAHGSRSTNPYPLSAIRYPLFRYPLSAIRYPLSATSH